MATNADDKKGAESDRKKRLATELRANLKRRKAKARAAAGPDGKTAKKPEQATRR